MNNNNRNNNNRRRGRGNNRGGNGNAQVNRIDSRARGNAPQMLEKYRKLAHDASLNDDRVMTEYYLQFADHYFRVIADARAQKEDTRPRRDAEDEFENERDYEDDPRHRHQRAPQAPRHAEPVEGAEGPEIDDNEDDNPFRPEPRHNQDNRSERSERKRTRPARRTERNDDAENDAPLGLDPGLLPPAIARAHDEGAAEDAPQPESADDGDEAPRPARTRKPLSTRARKPRTAAVDAPGDARGEDGDEEALEAVG